MSESYCFFSKNKWNFFILSFETTCHSILDRWFVVLIHFVKYILQPSLDPFQLSSIVWKWHFINSKLKASFNIEVTRDIYSSFNEQEEPFYKNILLFKGKDSDMLTLRSKSSLKKSLILLNNLNNLNV